MALTTSSEALWLTFWLALPIFVKRPLSASNLSISSPEFGVAWAVMVQSTKIVRTRAGGIIRMAPSILEGLVLRQLTTSNRFHLYTVDFSWI
ncbi:hypothetical protein [Polaromonas naphthalenivorans]|uniref:hypothetical protein n=1 Tax=Polaromonas naphthalenivorans TaxID=216465 RepID=UPI0038CD7779